VAALLGSAGCGSDSTGPGDGGALRPTFDTHVTDVAHVALIVPPGAISGEDIKTHSFIQTDGTSVPVYAPVDMRLTEGTWVGASNDYGLGFEINAGFRIRFAHITHPRADIVALIPTHDPSSIMVPVGPMSFDVGELIGHTTGTAETNRFDFGLYDLTEETATPNAARYRSLRFWTKLHGVCPYAYFSAGLRPAYEALFASIGGASVPGAPCRTLADVALAGTVAGEWYLTSHPPDATHRSQFAVGSQLTGVVRIAGLGGTLDFPGAADPRTISTEVCYPTADGRHVYLRLTSATTLDAVLKAGACAPSFPGEAFRSYAR
jgi:hypothetical protein